MQTNSVDSVFVRSWTLLRSNWSIIIPGLLLAIVGRIITAILAPPMNHSDSSDVTLVGTASSVFGHILRLVPSVLLTIVAITYTTGMAQAAWDRGSATFADGSRSFSEHAGRMLVTIALLFILGLIMTALALFTPASTLASAFFFIYATGYTMASAVVSNRSGFEALKESANIALRRLRPTLIVGFIVGYGVAESIAGTLTFIPFLGNIVAVAILQAVASYVTLVIVGDYLAFRAVGSPPMTDFMAPYLDISDVSRVSLLRKRLGRAAFSTKAIGLFSGIVVVVVVVVYMHGYVGPLLALALSILIFWCATRLSRVASS